MNFEHNSVRPAQELLSLNGSKNWPLHTEPLWWPGLQKPLTNLWRISLSSRGNVSEARRQGSTAITCWLGLSVVSKVPGTTKRVENRVPVSRCRIRIIRGLLRDWTYGGHVGKLAVPYKGVPLKIKNYFDDWIASYICRSRCTPTRGETKGHHFVWPISFDTSR